MKQQTSFIRGLAAAQALILGVAVACPLVWANDDRDELTLATLKFFIEFNETDQDIGVQTLLGGEPYKKLSAYGPDERKILDLRPRRGLRRQGMSDFFFESAEPTLDDVPLEEFLSRFPEGPYEFETVTLEGVEQDGETLLTHAIPAGPVIVFPKQGDVVDRNDVVVMWEPVTMTTSFNPPQKSVDIVGYQVIVTRAEPLRAYSVEVSADTKSVTIPPEFLDPGTEYELEILAIEESDNQTISLLFFQTAE